MLAIDKLDNNKNLLRKHYEDYDIINRISNILEDIIDENTIIVNIGTDRVIYDAIAPLIGTYLKDRKCSISVYGTLSNPIHALNLEEKLYEIKSKHPFDKIIAIDACIGEGLGDVVIDNTPVSPGSGVNKDLPKVGDYSIKLIMSNSLIIHRNMRLNFVMEMGKIVGKSILKVVNNKKLNNREVALTDYYGRSL